MTLLSDSEYAKVNDLSCGEKIKVQSTGGSRRSVPGGSHQIAGAGPELRLLSPIRDVWCSCDAAVIPE